MVVTRSCSILNEEIYLYKAFGFELSLVVYAVVVNIAALNNGGNIAAGMSYVVIFSVIG